MAMASRNMDAIRLFTDAMAKTVERTADHKNEGEQIDLFDQKTPSIRRSEEVAGGIERFLRKMAIGDPSSFTSYQKILDHVILTCPFAVQSKEITASLRTLNSEGRVHKEGLSTGITKDSYSI